MDIWSYSLLSGIVMTKLLVNVKDDKSIYNKRNVVITVIATITGYITFIINS